MDREHIHIGKDPVVAAESIFSEKGDVSDRKPLPFNQY